MAVRVNDRVRVEAGHGGEIVVMAAWCGKCKAEAMPVGDGECPWCGSRIVDESQLSARAMVAQIRGGRVGGLEEAEAVGAASDSVSSNPGRGASRLARGELQATVLREIAAGRQTAVEIGGALGRTNAKLISASLSTLMKKRLVDRVSWGVYALTEDGREAVAERANPDSGRAAASAPTSPQGNTAARPAESEREPQAECEADLASDSQRLVSPRAVAAEGAASRSEIGPLDLIRLIEDIDIGAITVTRWRNGEGDQDEATEQRIRQIVRDSLGGWCASEIGEAVIEHVDREIA